MDARPCELCLVWCWIFLCVCVPWTQLETIESFQFLCLFCVGGIMAMFHFRPVFLTTDTEPPEVSTLCHSGWWGRNASWARANLEEGPADPSGWLVPPAAVPCTCALSRAQTGTPRGPSARLPSSLCSSFRLVSCPPGVLPPDLWLFGLSDSPLRCLNWDPSGPSWVPSPPCRSIQPATAASPRRFPSCRGHHALLPDVQCLENCHTFVQCPVV